MVCANDPEAAFLGPKLWDKPISLPPLDDTEFSIMNIDDFLNENNISLDADPVMPANPSKENTPEPGASNAAAAAMAMSPNSTMLRTKMEQMDMASSPEETYGQEDDDEAGNNDREEEENEAKPRRGTKRPAGPRNQLPKVRFLYYFRTVLGNIESKLYMSHEIRESSFFIEISGHPPEMIYFSPSVKPETKDQTTHPNCVYVRVRILTALCFLSLQDTDNTFLYAESKRARAEREKEEKKRKLEIDFAPEDLALATIPGADFDPRKRAFSTDELRPQPIIRKRKKVS